MIKYGVEYVLGEEKKCWILFLTHQKKHTKRVANC